MIKLRKLQNHIICTSRDINKIIRLRTNVPMERLNDVIKNVFDYNFITKNI